jgi:signal transduction histidine kinase
MSKSLKPAYLKIEPAVLAYERDKKGIYYAYVTIWTIIFAVPLFWLLDLIFLREFWDTMLLVRLVTGVATYLLNYYGLKRKWNYLFTLNAVVGLNMVSAAIICAWVPFAFSLPYFLIFSVMVLLLNTTIFWEVSYSIVHTALTYLIIILLYGFKNNIESYSTLVTYGGGTYFVVSAFACLIAYNRYKILMREIEKNIIIDNANTQLLEQNEQINDQNILIEEANRRLRQLSDYRQNTLRIMIHDLKNFIGSNQMSIDLITRKSANLTPEQKEILSYINMGNKKLHYLSGKLADSAEADSGQVEYRYERFDAVPEIEAAAVSLVDAAAMKEVQMQFHITPDAMFINADKIFFNHILYKLISNIIRFTQKGTVIDLLVANIDGNCIIELKDNAPALGKAQMDELFNKLSNPNEAQQALNQTGFGFSVARQLTESMNGQFYYSCSDAQGNYYRITFKLV